MVPRPPLPMAEGPWGPGAEVCGRGHGDAGRPVTFSSVLTPPAPPSLHTYTHSHTLTLHTHIHTQHAHSDTPEKLPRCLESSCTPVSTCLSSKERDASLPSSPAVPNSSAPEAIGCHGVTTDCAP